jgi:hypothetical protein
MKKIFTVFVVFLFIAFFMTGCCFARNHRLLGNVVYEFGNDEMNQDSILLTGTAPTHSTLGGAIVAKAKGEEDFLEKYPDSTLRYLAVSEDQGFFYITKVFQKSPCMCETKKSQK